MAYQSNKLLLELGICSSLALLAATQIPATNAYGEALNRLQVLGNASIGDQPRAEYRRALTATEQAFPSAKTSADGAKWILDMPEYPAELFGAKGDAKQTGNGAITTGTTTFTSSGAGFTAADVGKLIMIAGAGSGRQLRTTIASVTNSTTVELTDAAATTVSNAATVWGTPDRVACQAMLDFCSAVKGRAVFSPGKTYLIEQVTNQTEPPLRYKDNATILIRGDIIHLDPNAGGFVLCDQYFRIDGSAYTTNLILRFEGGKIIFPDAWSSDVGGLQKKAFSVSCTDGFEVWAPRISGNNIGSFNTQYFRCKNGTVIGSRLIAGNGIGEDGVHLSHNCSDIIFSSMLIYSGDDAFSATCELNVGAGGTGNGNTTIERITLDNSLLFVNGFSGIKILTDAAALASTIRDILISNCIVKSKAGSSGQACLVNNGGYSAGGRIEDIRFSNVIFDVGSSTLATHQVLVNQCARVVFDNCYFKGTRESFINFTFGKDCGVRNSEFVQSIPETAIATGLTVSQINWSTGNSVVVAFSGSPDLSAVTTSHKLFLAGAVNSTIHDGGFDISAVDNTAKTITISNFKVSSAAADETTGATVDISTVRANAAIRVNAMEGLFFENNRISDWYGFALSQIQASAANAYTGLTLNRKVRFVGNRAENCFFRFGWDITNTQTSLFERNWFTNTRGGTMFSEGSGVVNNVYRGNTDNGRYFGRMGSLAVVGGSNTRPRHSGNDGYGGDDITGTVTILNGQTSRTVTLDRSMFFMASDGSTVDPNWVTCQHTAAVKVTRSGAVLTFTVASAVGSDTAIPYRIRA